MRAVFFGERDSTFSRLHVAQLTRHADVVLWVTGEKKRNEVARQPFLSRRDWWERLAARFKFEMQVLRAFGKPARFLFTDCPMHAARRGDPDLYEIVARAAPDIIISAGYRYILPDAILKVARRGAFNCHPSLLPRYAGSNPWFWILRHGENVSGVTIHRMVAEADAGDIVAQEEFPLAPNMNHQALYNESSIRSVRLLAKVLEDLKANTLNSRPQDLSHYQFFPAPREADYKIDWNSSAAEIQNLIRAALPAPGAWTTIAGQRVTVRRANVVTQQNGMPGQVIEATRNGIFIGCGNEALRIRTLEWDGQECDSKNAIQFLDIRAREQLS